jgi:mRNA interferase MazF
MINSGEIWLVNFSPQIGQEISKVRPAVVVNHDSVGILKLKIVVPLTDAIKTPKEWLIAISPTLSNGLAKESVADCFQIKSISEERFIKRIGRLSNDDFDSIRIGLVKVLGLL